MERRRILPTLLFASLLICLACRGREPVVHPPVQGEAVLPSVLIEDVPHVRQKPDFCGEAVTESYLRARGENIDQDQVFGLSGMDPARGIGATSREMKTALEALGFEVGKVWNTARADSDADLEKQFGALHQDLMRGVLFEDAASYDAYNRTVEDPPDTPYGYYSPSDGALVMNISTGGGTLVHEIVHPFIEANFPDSPVWFNEGLGSLYEQSGMRGGHIIGLAVYKR